MTRDFAHIESTVAHIVAGRIRERGLSITPSEIADLLEAGLTSTDVISILLRVEQQFTISFNDQDVTPTNFQSIHSIARITEHVLRRVSSP